ncbi:hypothetical protein SH467x_000582 [Pirellulaceae bacterium SH467]
MTVTLGDGCELNYRGDLGEVRKAIEVVRDRVDFKRIHTRQLSGERLRFDVYLCDFESQGFTLLKAGVSMATVKHLVSTWDPRIQGGALLYWPSGIHAHAAFTEADEINEETTDDSEVLIVEVR